MRSIVPVFCVLGLASCVVDKDEEDDDVDLTEEVGPSGGDAGSGSGAGDGADSGSGTGAGTGGSTGGGTGGSTVPGVDTGVRPDSGWDDGGWDDGSGTGGSVSVGDLRGVAGVAIQEAGCSILWDVYGPQCAGCDYGWDVSLSDSGAGSCDFGDDTSGTLSYHYGAVYFQGTYWGSASLGGGRLDWSSYAYMDGPGGYSYYYVGSASY